MGFYPNQFFASLANDWRNRKINSSYVSTEEIDKRVTSKKTSHTNQSPVKMIGTKQDYKFARTCYDVGKDQHFFEALKKYSDTYIKAFEEGKVRTPFTHADGDIYNFTKPFYTLPKAESNEGFKDICNYYDALARVFVQKASKEDIELVESSVQYLYDTCNANFFKKLAWGILHGFICGWMDEEQLANLIPEFSARKKYTDTRRINAWNMAIDTNIDVPVEIRRMFMANSDGQVAALFFLVPEAEQEHPEEEADDPLSAVGNNAEVVDIDPDKIKETLKPQKTPSTQPEPVKVAPNPEDIKKAPKPELHTVVPQQPSPAEVAPEVDKNGNISIPEPPVKPDTPINTPFVKEVKPSEDKASVAPNFDSLKTGSENKNAVDFGDPAEKHDFNDVLKQAREVLLKEQERRQQEAQNSNPQPEPVQVDYQPVAPDDVPLDWNWDPTSIDAQNNEEYHKRVIGLDRFTKMVHEQNKIVNYSDLEEYPGLIKATIFGLNPKEKITDINNPRANRGFVVIDPRVIYGDTIRVYQFYNGIDIRRQWSVPLYNEVIIKKMIAETYTPADERYVKAQIPSELQNSLTGKYWFIDRVDMSGIYEEVGDLTNENWRKLVTNIAKILKGDKALAGIRFRIYGYESPSKFKMIADEKVKYPFTSAIENTIQNQEAIRVGRKVAASTNKDGKLIWNLQTTKI
jgi:hypothetical protein